MQKKKQKNCTWEMAKNTKHVFFFFFFEAGSLLAFYFASVKHHYQMSGIKYLNSIRKS